MFNNYEYFITLAEEENISRAAEKLFISHQCLSKYLKNLEEGMRGSMMDYVIASLQETPLMDVFPFGVKDDKPEVQ